MKTLAWLAASLVLALPAFVPPARGAGLLGVTTSPADNIKPTSAGLHGLLYPQDTQPITVFFEWGTTTNYGNSITQCCYGGIGGTFFPNDNAANLSPSTTYQYRILASNYAGIAFGSNVSFTTTPATKPSVTTLAATTDLDATVWNLNSTVEPNGLATVAFFEWGRTTNYTNTTTPTTILDTIAFSAQLNGLSTNAVYHFRIVASNALGVTVGADRFFGTSGSLFFGNNLRNAILAGGTVTFIDDGTVQLAPELVITNNVTIDANGHQVILDSSGHRLFHVRPGTELRLIGLTIQNAAWVNQGGDVGAAIRVENALLAATNCSFTGNHVGGANGQSIFIDFNHTTGLPGQDAKGGAIGATDSQVFIVDCMFRGNYAEGGFGGYGYSRGSFYYGADGSSLGGAIYALRGQLKIANSTFEANRAVPRPPRFPTVSYAGGAIFAEGGQVEIDSSTFAQNVAHKNGGAIFNSGLLFLTNSTFSGNWSTLDGTALITSNGTNWLSHCTVASNSFPNATYGSSSGAAIANQSGAFALAGCILSGNAAGNAAGTITDLGHNISSSASPAWTAGTSLNNTDPLLLPLANNGGPTLTMALRASSPALNNADCGAAPPTDQRGYPRPSGPGCDIGAYEGAGVPRLEIIRENSSTNKLRWLAEASRTYRLDESAALSGWTPLATNTALSNGWIELRIPANASPRFFQLIAQ